MKPVLFSLAAAALIGFAGSAFAHDAVQPSDTRSPLEIVAAFGTALDAGDEEALARLMASDVQIAESGHIERSLEEYRAHHMAADIAFAEAVATTVLDRRVYEGDSLATVITEAVSRGTFRERPVNSRLMETMVLKLTDGDWKIVHIHWSSAKISEDESH